LKPLLERAGVKAEVAEVKAVKPARKRRVAEDVAAE
jgi:hypothetical protein